MGDAALRSSDSASDSALLCSLGRQSGIDPAAARSVGPREKCPLAAEKLSLTPTAAGSLRRPAGHLNGQVTGSSSSSSRKRPMGDILSLCGPRAAFVPLCAGWPTNNKSSEWKHQTVQQATGGQLARETLRAANSVLGSRATAKTNHRRQRTEAGRRWFRHTSARGRMGASWLGLGEVKCGRAARSARSCRLAGRNVDGRSLTSEKQQVCGPSGGVTVPVSARNVRSLLVCLLTLRQVHLVESRLASDR